MPSLQIPYAFTNNKLPVSPQVAEKGQDFSCPICDSEVVLSVETSGSLILPISQIQGVLAKVFAIRSQNR